MIVADFLTEVVLDDRVGFIRRDGEIGGGHPVDKIPFEHRGVARDDPAAFLGRELGRVRAGRDQSLDRPFDALLDRRCVRWLGRHVPISAFRASLVTARNCGGLAPQSSQWISETQEAEPCREPGGGPRVSATASPSLVGPSGRTCRTASCDTFASRLDAMCWSLVPVPGWS